MSRLASPYSLALKKKKPPLAGTASPLLLGPSRSIAGTPPQQPQQLQQPVNTGQNLLGPPAPAPAPAPAPPTSPQRFTPGGGPGRPPQQWKPPVLPPQQKSWWQNLPPPAAPGPSGSPVDYSGKGKLPIPLPIYRQYDPSVAQGNPAPVPPGTMQTLPGYGPTQTPAQPSPVAPMPSQGAYGQNQQPRQPANMGQQYPWGSPGGFDANGKPLPPNAPGTTQQPVTVAGDLQAQIDAANAANEARYGQAQDIAGSGGQAALTDLNQSYTGQTGQLGKLQGERRGAQVGEMGYLGGLYGGLGKELATYTDTQSQDIEDQRNRQQADLKQSLYSRGLASSTVGDSISQGIDRSATRSKQDVGNQMLDRRLNLGERGGLAGYGAMTTGNRDVEGLGTAGMNLSQQYGQNRQSQLSRSQQQLLDIILGRTDQGPPLDMYYQAMSQPGAQPNLPEGVKPYKSGKLPDNEAWKKLLEAMLGRSA